MSEADKKLKIALDETRVLMLGAQILFGFHLRAVFQNRFDELSLVLRVVYVFAFASMAIVIALLIVPSLHHRIIVRGQTSGRVLTAATRFASLALLPFAISLGADVGLVTAYQFGTAVGVELGFAATALALLLWYGVEWTLRKPRDEDDTMPEKHTPIDIRVEDLLTEARVLLPGAQALFGFQLVVLLTESFEKLPQTSKIIHTIALCSVAVSIILLMAPPAFHRITFGGRNSKDFLRIGSALVIASAVPLAAGIAADMYVAVSKAVAASDVGLGVALAVAAMLAILWFIQPVLLRLKMRSRQTRQSS